MLGLALVTGCTCAMPSSDAIPVPAPAVVAIARDRPGPTSIAFDRDHVYWVERATGDVMRAHRGGGEATLVGSTGWTQSDSLAVGGGFVYYTHPGEGSTYRLPTGGGAPERIGPPGALAADATHVYVAGATLVRIPHVDAAEEHWPTRTSLEETSPGEAMPGGILGLGPTAACTIDDDGVLRCATLDGGEVRTLARGFGRSFRLALAVSNAHVYASDGDGGVTLRVPLAGGPPELAGDATGVADAIAADARFLYVAGVDGIVRRIDPVRATHETITSIPGTNRNHVSVALDGASLFVASDASSSTVPHIDLTGRTPLPEGDLVRWEGFVGAVDVGRAGDGSRPLEHFAFVAWIDHEDDASLDGAVDRALGGVPAFAAGLRSGRLALRLSCADGALAERTAARVRDRLVPTHGAQVHVLVDPSLPIRARREQCEIVVDLRELAASYAP